MRRPRAGGLLAALLVTAALSAGCGGDDDKGSSGGGGDGQADSGDSVFGGSKDCKDADDTLKKVAREHVAPLTEEDVDKIEVEVCRTTDENATAKITVYGLQDDSIRDVRHDIRLIKTGGLWQVTDDFDTRRCQSGRGPQEFSGTFCQ